MYLQCDIDGEVDVLRECLGVESGDYIKCLKKGWNKKRAGKQMKIMWGKRVGALKRECCDLLSNYALQKAA